jgi:hypothetical protein
MPLPKVLAKVLQRNACLQHEQDAVEEGFIAHCELASTTPSRRHEDQDKGLQLLLQLTRCTCIACPIEEKALHQSAFFVATEIDL